MCAFNEQTKDILDTIADGIVVIGIDYKIAFVNKAMLGLCGLQKEEDIVGKECYDFAHRCSVPCYQQNSPDNLTCPYHEGFAQGKSVSVTHCHHMPDGSDKTFHITASPIKDAQDSVTHIIEVYRDVTENTKAVETLRGREAFIENILETVDEGFIVIDHDYRILSANKAYCRQVKCTAEKIVGRYCYEISHHLERPCFHEGEECAPSHTFRTGKPHVTIHTHYDSEERPVYVETKSYPLKDASGNITSVIETLNNISEQRRLEAQLRHSQKMEAIGTLAGGIAHDFNNMLNVIIGYGGLMQMRMKEDDPNLINLSEVLAAAERATQLTKGLLSFSRKQIMELKPVNVNVIVHGFKKMLERIIGEDVKLKIITPDEDLTIMADTGQIEQVLMNLAVNARDAMPHGGVLSVQLKTTEIDDNFIIKHGYGEVGNYALITVSDTGSGIDEDTVRRIFEPYFTTKAMGKGTGLGLSIVYGIVKQHKGYIKCQSEPDEGTTFSIYLPLVISNARGIEEIAQTRPEGGTETILIAEDEPVVRNLIKTMLEDFGYTVIEAADGEDAVTRFREKKADISLLLFDVVMPGKNGKAAYDEIQAIHPDIPAIFISGYAPDLIRNIGVFENDADFISKPVRTNELLHKVREVLDR